MGVKADMALHVDVTGQGNHDSYYVLGGSMFLCEMGVKANAALHVDVTGPGIMTVIMSWVAQCFCYDPYL